MPATKYLSKEAEKRIPAHLKNHQTLSDFPNFSSSGSIIGMKKRYYGKDALLVRQGAYIYNVSSCPCFWDYAN